MGMFGPSRRQVFKPSVYQPGRHNRRLPRGLGLLFIGIALGAGGVLFLQTNYGPPRLTTEQSEQVRSELNAATLERQRLQVQIDDLQRQLEASHAAAQNQTPPLPESGDAAPAPAPAATAAPSVQAPVAAPPVVAAPAPAAAASATAAPAAAAMPAPAETATPNAGEQAAAPSAEAAKPPVHRPVHRDYQEPHSELRMTIIPMPAQSK